jgi:hypothetical protein
VLLSGVIGTQNSPIGAHAFSVVAKRDGREGGFQDGGYFSTSLNRK